MVIQRLQNLYLFLSAVLMTVFAYVNVFFVESADLSLSVGCMGTYDVNGLSLSPISIVLAVLAVVLPLLTLSKFALRRMLSGQVRFDCIPCNYRFRSVFGIECCCELCGNGFNCGSRSSRLVSAPRNSTRHKVATRQRPNPLTI